LISKNNYDAVIIGGGAAGMMCAGVAGQRGLKTLLIEHTDILGEKIRISGGGRCNFTNIHCTPKNFLSQNPHFCKSALARYTQHDFIKLVEKHGIRWHEKTLGQLFCDDSSQQIIDMLKAEMEKGAVDISLSTTVKKIEQANKGFILATSSGTISAKKIVIATGGLSIPKIGATGFGYDVARQFGHTIIDTAAALVPLTFAPDVLSRTKTLSGLSAPDSLVSCDSASFREGLLFTHKGLSGPSILQISSYWSEGKNISVNFTAAQDVFAALKTARQNRDKSMLHNALSAFIPKRLAEMICAETGIDAPLPDLSDAKLKTIADHVTKWRVTPTGTEGYRTAEVTRGGVDTTQLSSKKMESNIVSGLYFIGEVVDVTGWLGGFNFQWAWSSGWVAGQSL
jgi:predicted Rossmann fold flavoprotein